MWPSRNSHTHTHTKSAVLSVSSLHYHLLNYSFQRLFSRLDLYIATVLYIQ